jgi:hypothetical protein
MDEPPHKRQKGILVYIPRVPPPDPRLWRWLHAVNHTHYHMFNAQQGGELGLDIMSYMQKHGMDPYGPTPHPRMVDLGLGQDQMLRGIQHEAEAIRKQSEALSALEESQGAPHAMTTTAPASQRELEPSKSRGWTVDPTDVVRPPEVVAGSTRAPDVVPLSFEDGVWARRAKHASHGIEPVAK